MAYLFLVLREANGLAEGQDVQLVLPGDICIQKYYKLSIPLKGMLNLFIYLLHIFNKN